MHGFHGTHKECTEEFVSAVHVFYLYCIVAVSLREMIPQIVFNQCSRWERTGSNYTALHSFALSNVSCCASFCITVWQDRRTDNESPIYISAVSLSSTFDFHFICILGGLLPLHWTCWIVFLKSVRVFWKESKEPRECSKRKFYLKIFWGRIQLQTWDCDRIRHVSRISLPLLVNLN